MIENTEKLYADDAKRIYSRVEQRTTILPSASISRLTIKEAFCRLHEEWALVGANELASLAGSQLTFVGRTSQSHTNKIFHVLPWLWNLLVGSLFTCTLYLPGEKYTVFLQPDSTDYSRLKTEPFRIVLVHDFEWEFGLLVDLSADWASALGKNDPLVLG
jgi:hypothetical protein